MNKKTLTMILAGAVLVVIIAVVVLLFFCKEQQGEKQPAVGSYTAEQPETEESTEPAIEETETKQTETKQSEPEPSETEPEQETETGEPGSPEESETASREETESESRETETEIEESTEPESETQPEESSKPAESKPATTPESTPASTPGTATTPERPPVADTTPEPAPHTCSWDGGTVTTAASCVSEGVKTYRCSGCGATRTEAIPKTADHYMVETGRDGAKCHAEGTITYTCAYCGVQTTAPIPALGGEHQWVEIWFNYPDCTFGGSGHGRECSICGYAEQLPESGPLGHLADAGTVEWQGNCVYPSILSHKCVRCGSDLPDTEGAIDPNNHDWATDRETGIEYCAMCGLTR